MPGSRWGSLVTDRATRRWVVAQAPTQLAAATRAVDELRSRLTNGSAG